MSNIVLIVLALLFVLFIVIPIIKGLFKVLLFSVAIGIVFFLYLSYQDITFDEFIENIQNNIQQGEEIKS